MVGRRAPINESGYAELVRRHRGDERPESRLRLSYLLLPHPHPRLAGISGRGIQCAMLRSVLRSPLLPRSQFLRPPPRAVAIHPPGTRALASPSGLVTPEHVHEHLSVYAHHDHYYAGPSSPPSKVPFVSNRLKGVGDHGFVLRAGGVRHHLYLSLGDVRGFHYTRRNEISPLPLLAGLLKVSVASGSSRAEI